MHRQLRRDAHARDGIITDEPALARQVIDYRKEMGPAEKALLSLAAILGIDVQSRIYRDDSP